MSELTDDQKRSIEMNDQKDLSQDDHTGTEPQGETFRERIVGLKDTVSEKASDLKNSIQEKAADLKDSIKNEVSNLKDIPKDKVSQAIVVASFTAFTNIGGNIETGIHNAGITEINITRQQKQPEIVERDSPSDHTNLSSSSQPQEQTIVKKPDDPSEPPIEPPEDADDDAGKVRKDIDERREEINEAIRRAAKG